MVHKGYWVECFPMSQNDNIGQDLYSASSDAFPKTTCTGKSVDQAIERLQNKLKKVQKMYHENGMALPRSHSITSPTARHRKEKDWMSIYITLEDVER